MRHPTDADRLSVRHRPDGQPIMHQEWGNLLFMHWRIEESLLRPHIPEPLEIDTFGDSAWIAIAPFTMWDIRAFPPFMPPLPGFDSMEELNVRTYVHYNGVPGVWFFSLDANNRALVLGGRTFFHLPYYHAEIRMEGKYKIKYQSRRLDEPEAVFKAEWSAGKALPRSQPESREFFLTERYFLYSAFEGELYRSRIHHKPWELHEAELTDFASSMLEAKQIPQPKTQPILHHAEQISVDIWPLERVET